jgi:hypothetical protein
VETAEEHVSNLTKLSFLTFFLIIGADSAVKAADIGISEIGVFAARAKGSKWDSYLLSDKYDKAEYKYPLIASQAAAGLPPGSLVITSSEARTYIVAITAYTLDKKRESTQCKTVYWAVMRKQTRDDNTNSIVDSFKIPLSGAQELSDRLLNISGITWAGTQRFPICDNGNKIFSIFNYDETSGSTNTNSSKGYKKVGSIISSDVSKEYVFQFTPYSTYAYGLPSPSN